VGHQGRPGTGSSQGKEKYRLPVNQGNMKIGGGGANKENKSGVV